MSKRVKSVKKGAEKHPFVVALTGGIASGKSWVADYLHRVHDIDVIDADMVARTLVMPHQPAWQAICQHFGQGICLADGYLDRGKLRALIFSDERKKSWLESLLHPLIRQQMQASIQTVTSPYVLMVIPLLVETGVPEYVEQVWLVDCSVETQRLRLLGRQADMDETVAMQIINSQATREQRIAVADVVLQNDGDLMQLQKQVEQLHQEMMNSLV